MIKSLTVINYRGETKKIELNNPWTTGFAVEKIEGLGPVRADINMTDRSSGDGAVFNSARAQTRNILIYLRFGHSSSASVEKNRMETYTLFPLKRQVTLLIETDTRTYKAVGYVESNEPNIFSSSEGCQISILCPDSYLRDANEADANVVVGLTDGSFEFEFSNESLTQSLIEFGKVSQILEFGILSTSQVDSGLTIRIDAKNLISQGVTNYLIFERVGTNESLVLEFDKLDGGKLLKDDVLVFTTSKGNKNVWLTRNGVATKVNKVVQRGSIWPQMSPGQNYYKMNMPLTNLTELDVSCEYEVLYQGV